MDGHGGGVGGDFANVTSAAATACAATATAAFADEGELGFDLSVFGEGLGVVEGDGGAGGVDAEGALVLGGEGADDVVDVADEEVGGVDEDAAVG